MSTRGNIIGVGIVLVVGAVVVAIIMLRSRDQERQMAECIQNGIQYFRDIGSYPTLSTGESAILAAESRCLRAPDTAFT